MPRKTTKQRAKVKSNKHVLGITILVFASLMLLLGTFIYFKVEKKNNAVCANSISCIKDLSGEKQADNQGVFMGKTVTATDSTIYALQETQAVLGTSDSANPTNKHLYVDLGRQRLYAFEGNTLVYNFPVSTGKWWPTPTGEFKIWIWLRYTRMSGGNTADGTYYNLPNVPYTMYFYNNSIPKWRGFGIHGAYWHDNFGHPMSHGCVNMKEEDVAQIYSWTYGNTSIPLTIYGVTPQE